MISQNLKALRRLKGLTQVQFAEAIGIKRSLVGAYEEGRAEPKLTTLSTIAHFFGVSVDDFIGRDLTGGVPSAAAAAAPRVLAITVDNRDGQENIELVPQRAAAGYLNGFADPEFVAELPRFRLPMSGLRDGTFRAFEISGDSMLPLPSGTVVVGRYVTDPARDVRDGAPYVVISPQEGIVFKRVYRRGKSGAARLELRSDNPAYQPYEVPAADVSELWEARAFVSTAFPPAPAGENSTVPSLPLDELTRLLRDLQRDVAVLKAK